MTDYLFPILIGLAVLVIGWYCYRNPKKRDDDDNTPGGLW